MPLKKVKKGSNMYQGWVSHTHSHLRGKCPHECSYCYVQAMANRFPVMKEIYSGEVELVEDQVNVDYGSDKLIFVEHMNDLFAKDVSDDIILKIIRHCLKYPENSYIFQTKNPQRYKNFAPFAPFIPSIPKNSICGTTIESNRIHEVMGKAPTPSQRIVGIREISALGYNTFITIEPILKFDLDEFANMLIWARPSFVNIGADSKGHGLEEPSYSDIMKLYDRLCDKGIEVRKKINLARLEKSE